MIPQAKILRVFQLIALLKAGGRTVAQLADQLNAAERTIYRYFKLLEEIGFIIDADFSGRYFIHRDEVESLEDQFTFDELGVLRQLIQQETKPPVQEHLLRKLAFHSESRDLPKQFLKLRVAKLFRALSDAIENKRQVILKNYHSANSQAITDRLIEPFQFGEGFQSVQALDVKDKQCKYFKLERIGEVIVQKKPFKFEKLHERTNIDIFGVSGRKETWVNLRLSLRAYVLMREEFPLALPYLEKDADETVRSYLFHGPVLNFKGIGRFVLGLADEVTIMGPLDFKAYVKDKLKQQKLV